MISYISFKISTLMTPFLFSLNTSDKYEQNYYICLLTILYHSRRINKEVYRLIYNPDIQSSPALSLWQSPVTVEFMGVISTLLTVLSCLYLSNTSIKLHVVITI